MLSTTIDSTHRNHMENNKNPSKDRHTRFIFHHSFISVFSSREYSLPASVLQLILIMAGVEPNPGPQIWLCSVCGIRITNNIPSVKCNQCSNWCHLKHCTTLKSHREWTEDFIADCCREQQGQRAVWICTVCNMPIHKNIISVQCSNCEGWCHMRRCSGLVNHKARTTNFITPCCSQAAQTCQNDNTSPPSTPGATSIIPTILTPCQQLSAVLLLLHQ